jgi:hypothetical protein
MLELFKLAYLFITDPDARNLSPFTYDNGNGMSIREAKEFGLYLDGKPLIDERIQNVVDKSQSGSAEDKAIYDMVSWNIANWKCKDYYYNKSIAEGVILVKKCGPAFIKGNNIFIPTEEFGDIPVIKLTK